MASPPIGLMAVLGSPSFVDIFASGTLDTTNWLVSNYETNDYAGGGSNVTFSPSNVSLSQGCLCLTLDQPTTETSIGGELQSVKTFGYGTYEWVVRMSSTSSTPQGSGAAVSGSDSALFTYIDNSETEIDIEFTGNLPDVISLTNWINPNPADAPTENQTSSPSISGLDTGWHSYMMIWSATQIEWFIDGKSVAIHTKDIPTTPAYMMINFWGTNSSNWGGVATPNVIRYMYVSWASYTPAS